MKDHQKLLLGAHMSIAGGLKNAITRGESIDCSCIQLFTKNNRQWFAKKITQDDIVDFEKTAQISPILKKNMFVHATYLINLGSPKADLAKKSQKALGDELERCQLLGIPYLIFHPGAHLNTDEQSCLEQIAESLNNIFEAHPGSTKILLENTAGQGSTVCYTFEQLAFVRSLCSFKDRLGICFDTCHAFAAGYNFSTKKSYDAMWREFDKIIGIKHIKAMHINDSKKECGSRIDRHEFIGKGKIGLDGFKLLVNDERFFDVPKILETPVKTMQEYIKDMEIIKTLIAPHNKFLLKK